MPYPFVQPLLASPCPTECRESPSPGLPPGSTSRTLKVPFKAFLLVCLTVFVDSLGGSISAPVLPFLAKQDFGAGDFDIGILFSAFSVAQVIFLPVLGRLADTFGRRRILVASLFGAALGAWSQGLAWSYSFLLIARLVSGACGAVGSTAAVYVSDITADQVRGEYLGYLISSNGAAFAFGPGLGGGLSRLGYRVPIKVNGVLCAVAGLLTYFYLPESPVCAFVPHGDGLLHEEQGLPRGIWAMVAVEFLRGLSFSAIFAFYGLFANDVYGLDPLHIGFVVCLGAITLIVTNVWIYCPLQRVAGQIRTTNIGLLLMALGEITLAYAPGLWISLLGLWTVYAGQAIAGATIATIASMLSDDHNRGEVMSLQQMSQALGRVAGPLVLGKLSEKDPRLPFCLAAACVVLAAGMTRTLSSEYQQKLEREWSVKSPVEERKEALDPQRISKAEAEEIGRFVSKLLLSESYKWHGEDTREALEEALLHAVQKHFTPARRDSDHGRSRLETMEDFEDEVSRLASKEFRGASITLTGDDSNFLASPPGSVRRVFLAQKGRSKSYHEGLTKTPHPR